MFQPSNTPCQIGHNIHPIENQRYFTGSPCHFTGDIPHNISLSVIFPSSSAPTGIFSQKTSFNSPGWFQMEVSIAIWVPPKKMVLNPGKSLKIPFKLMDDNWGNPMFGNLQMLFPFPIPRLSFSRGSGILWPERSVPHGPPRASASPRGARKVRGRKVSRRSNKSWRRSQPGKMPGIL